MAASQPWLGRCSAAVLVAALQVVGAVVPRLPPRLWGAAAWVLGRAFWYGVPRYRRIALTNLVQGEGLPRREAARRAKASFTSNALVLFESLAMDRLMHQRGITVDEEVTPEARAVLADLREGRIPLVIGVAGHTGVWEFHGAWFARQVLPAPTLVSARLPRNPRIAAYLAGLRQGFGLTLVPKDEYLRRVMRRVRERQPTFCVFLCDQHFRHGHRLPFLDRPACTVGVPATLMLKYRAPGLIGGCTRQGPGRYRMELRALPVEPYLERDREQAARDLTAEVNRQISALIRATPEQWTWGHRRWRPCCAADADAHD